MNPTVTTHPQERTAQLVWTAFILSFFLIQAVLWTVAITFTANDRSHAVIADFEQKSLHWDETRALERASLALGWQPVLQVDPAADIRGNRTITLALHDRDGQPVEASSVTLRAFHLGRAADVQELTLKSDSAGVLSGLVRIDKTGNWAFSGAVVSGPDTFFVNERIHVKK